MWYIISATDPSVKYCLLVGKDITVGRKDTDVVLGTDPTVSRKHAVIQVTHAEGNLGNPSKLPTVILKDESRYGTWVNGKQLPSKDQTMLNDGDQIKFGSPKSEFMCVYEPLVVSTSCLDTGQKKAVRKLVCKLGGHVVKDWQRDCSLLVMTSLSVTVKVVSAMVSLRPIVTMEYLTALEQALEKKEETPDTQHFTPALSDPHLNAEDVSFKPNPARKTLFKGKTFIFLSSIQFNKLSLTVEMAGGVPVLHESVIKETNSLVEDDTAVMHADPEDTSLTHKARQWVAKVLALLKRHKKRMIPDSEIGYAVVFCSTEKHCNPDLKPVEDLGMALPSQSLSERPFSQDPEVFVPNTEASQTISCRTAKRGKRLQLSQAQSTLPTASGVNLKCEDDKVTVKTESTDANSQVRGSGRVDDTGDFSVDVKSMGDVMTPAQNFTPRKRARESELEYDSMPNPKSARKDPERKRSPVKVKQEQEEESSLPRERTSQDGKTQKNTVDKAGHTDGSSSDDQGAFARPRRRNRQNVLVQDTEVHNYGREREKRLNLSDIEGPSRVSDSDTESKPSEGKSAGQGKERVSSPDDPEPSRRQMSPFKTKGRRNKDNVSVKTEPVSVIEDLDNSDTELFGGDENEEFPVPERKKMKTSPGAKIGATHAVQEAVEDDTDLNDNQINPIQQEMETVIEERPATCILDNDVPAGFLTTRLPIQNQVHAVAEFMKEEVTAQVCVEFKSLMVRRPRSNVTISRNLTDNEGFIFWKGKRVKNFKKFKKSHHVGSGSLPQIIGGSDLEPHLNNTRQELDEWYKDVLNAESQQNEADRMASQLFDWDSKPAAKGKAKRTR